MRKTALGFTLVELLVVIAIITILTGVSVSVFSTAQKSARDSRRKQEISSVAKALEASKNFSTGYYKYGTRNDPKTFEGDFPSTSDQPKDSLYCIWTKKKDDTNPSAARIPPTPPTSAYTTCPQIDGTAMNGEKISPSDASGYPGKAFDNIDFTNGEVASWTICANLENDVPFCRSSMSR